VEQYTCFTNGEWIGRPFRLQPWQRRLIYELFEVNDDDLRRYRWALVGVPKKNGKTELAAALALYFLLGDDEPSPLVVCAAASDEQADLVYGAAKTMVTMSPILSQTLRE
jgi:phage terminase large subunit-like protein